MTEPNTWYWIGLSEQAQAAIHAQWPGAVPWGDHRTITGRCPPGQHPLLGQPVRIVQVGATRPSVRLLQSALAKAPQSFLIQSPLSDLTALVQALQRWQWPAAPGVGVATPLASAPHLLAQCQSLAPACVLALVLWHESQLLQVACDSSTGQSPEPQLIALNLACFEHTWMGLAQHSLTSPAWQALLQHAQVRLQLSQALSGGLTMGLRNAYHLACWCAVALAPGQSEHAGEALAASVNLAGLAQRMHGLQLPAQFDAQAYQALARWPDVRHCTLAAPVAPLAHHWALNTLQLMGLQISKSTQPAHWLPFQAAGLLTAPHLAVPPWLQGGPVLAWGVSHTSGPQPLPLLDKNPQQLAAVLERLLAQQAAESREALQGYASPVLNEHLFTLFPLPHADSAALPHGHELVPVDVSRAAIQWRWQAEDDAPQPFSWALHQGPQGRLPVQASLQPASALADQLKASLLLNNLTLADKPPISALQLRVNWGKVLEPQPAGGVAPVLKLHAQLKVVWALDTPVLTADWELCEHSPALQVPLDVRAASEAPNTQELRLSLPLQAQQLPPPQQLSVSLPLYASPRLVCTALGGLLHVPRQQVCSLQVQLLIQVCPNHKALQCNIHLTYTPLQFTAYHRCAVLGHQAHQVQHTEPLQWASWEALAHA